MNPQQVSSTTAGIPPSVISGDPVWSPRGDKIAVADTNSWEGEIYVIDINSKVTRTITSPPGRKSEAVWTPDSTKVIFSNATVGILNEPSGPPQIWIANDDGSEKTKLAEWAAHPIILSNGRVAYFNITFYDATGNSTWWSMETDGTDKRPEGEFSTIVELSTILNPYLDEWSPDRTKILFMRERGIWVSNADGTGERLLLSDKDIFVNTTSGVQLTRGLESPKWSRDGQEIFFDITNDGLWMMDADGSNRVRLTSDGGTHPAMSPEGTEIAYRRNEGIFILDLRKPFPLYSYEYTISANENEHIASITSNNTVNNFTYNATALSFTQQKSYIEWELRANNYSHWNLTLPISLVSGEIKVYESRNGMPASVENATITKNATHYFVYSTSSLNNSYSLADGHAINVTNITVLYKGKDTNFLNSPLIIIAISVPIASIIAVATVLSLRKRRKPKTQLMKR